VLIVCLGAGVLAFIVAYLELNRVIDEVNDILRRKDD
jgi:hypothetical protein